MSTQSSKAALKGQEKADFVVASTRAYRAPVSAALGRIDGGVPAEGEQMPDWDLVREPDARPPEGQAPGSGPGAGAPAPAGTPSEPPTAARSRRGEMR